MPVEKISKNGTGSDYECTNLEVCLGDGSEAILYSGQIMVHGSEAQNVTIGNHDRHFNKYVDKVNKWSQKLFEERQNKAMTTEDQSWLSKLSQPTAAQANASLDVSTSHSPHLTHCWTFGKTETNPMNGATTVVTDAAMSSTKSFSFSLPSTKPAKLGPTEPTLTFLSKPIPAPWLTQCGGIGKTETIPVTGATNISNCPSAATSSTKSSSSNSFSNFSFSLHPKSATLGPTQPTLTFSSTKPIPASNAHSWGNCNGASTSTKKKPVFTPHVIYGITTPENNTPSKVNNNELKFEIPEKNADLGSPDVFTFGISSKASCLRSTNRKDRPGEEVTFTEGISTSQTNSKIISGATSESLKTTRLGSIGCAETSTSQNNSEMKSGATSESPKATCLGSIGCAEASTSQNNSEMKFGATSKSLKATCLGSIGCAEASTGQNNSEMKFGATSESPKATCLGSIDCAETSTSQINSEMKFGGTSKHPLSPTRETNSSKTRKTSVINNNKTVENANDKNEVLTASGLDVAASGHDEFEQRAQQGSGTNTRKLSVEDIRHKLFKAQQKCYQIQTSLFKTLVSKLRNFEDYLKLEAQKDTASEEVVLDKLQSLVLLLESLQMCLDIQSGLNHGLRTVLEETSKSAAEHEVCYDSCDEDISLSKDDLASIMEDKDDLLVESRSLMNHTAFAKSLVCVHLVNPYSSDIRYACGDDRVFGSCDLVPNIYYLPDGQGRLESLSRNLIYEGRWKKGKRWGYGKAFIFCGSELSASKKQYGMYQGCWWNNMRHGHGRIVFASSTEYKGEWQFDLMSGVGTMIYPDGSSLEGIWDENEPDGCGMYTWPNGKVEYREYKKGQVLRVIQLPENTRQMSTYHGNVVRDYTILRLKYQTLREEKAGLLQSNSRLTVALEVQTMDSITSKRKLECLHEEKVKTLRTEFRKLLYSKKVEIKEKHGIQVKKMKESHDSKTKELEDKISEVKKELDERKTALLCQICYDCDRDCIIMPCTHMLYCRDCISKEKKEGRNRCPACRGAISGEIYCNINL